jgi:hypothetical protein
MPVSPLKIDATPEQLAKAILKPLPRKPDDK